ncbi:MAG: hypothetical protein NZL92_12180, partial [Gloeomargarita sp. SKYG116]|nr:hypothetical protein [Gloeomargarita sp. SKYG116]MDW8402437.1 hypothetical protein [Gloeomargarita sp. SKYGB_i_bin116]
TSGINRRNSDDPSPYNQPSGSASNSNERFSEPYVLSRYITEEANALVTYEPLSVTDLRAMRLSPRTNPDDWELPILSLLNNRPVTDANLYQRET